MLYLGADQEKTVVSVTPLRMRAGRARRLRTGVVTEIVPRKPSGRTGGELLQAALVLLVAGALLSALGVPWLAAAATSFVLFTGIAVHRRRAARTGLIAVPRGDDASVLHAPEEREAFRRAVQTAHRVRKTWPFLNPMIDPDVAGRSLATALRELAAIMARRQSIRDLRLELDQAASHGLAADSAAVRALAEQRQRAEDLWRTTGAEANRILAGLQAAAEAGENLIREQRLHQTTRNAELAIVRLAAVGAPISEAAPELAERTAAVIAAYRELSEAA
ncbi:hypothetical protein [Actinoplanes sp. TFC3]|uniref:hypothetical protein n=1 Tax=Actinoplanes sp. TFC3 TaxID=1710355 RepID=UPI000B1EC19F|nr:hypothetical protein [Actinoplanes sp. TFC3]